MENTDKPASAPDRRGSGKIGFKPIEDEQLKESGPPGYSGPISMPEPEAVNNSLTGFFADVFSLYFHELLFRIILSFISRLFI